MEDEAASQRARFRGKNGAAFDCTANDGTFIVRSLLSM